MSETVKLIIEIPKELHEALLNGYEEPYSRMFSDVVKNGIPLDDVKAEIKAKEMVETDIEKQFYNMALGDVLDILENIGKGDKE